MRKTHRQAKQKSYQDCHGELKHSFGRECIAFLVTKLSGRMVRLPIEVWHSAIILGCSIHL